jgi:hypothetical protein
VPTRQWSWWSTASLKVSSEKDSPFGSLTMPLPSTLGIGDLCFPGSWITEIVGTLIGVCETHTAVSCSPGSPINVLLKSNCRTVLGTLINQHDISWMQKAHLNLGT